MKAVLCKEYGLPGKLVVEDVPSPKAATGQVVVSVKACGVNFPDTLIIQGKYQFKPEMPFSPGSCDFLGNGSQFLRHRGFQVQRNIVSRRCQRSRFWSARRGLHTIWEWPALSHGCRVAALRLRCAPPCSAARHDAIARARRRRGFSIG